MLETEDTLFSEYKRVDNICRDMFLSQSGISQYIAEMEKDSFHGYSMVPYWDRDYRKLKRVRWLRNQIAHESFATDCNEEDVAWLEEFHSRLLEQQDPLALLRKAKRERSTLPHPYESRPKIAFEQRPQGNAQSQRPEGNAQSEGKKAFSTERTAMRFIWKIAIFIGMVIIAFALDNGCSAH